MRGMVLVVMVACVATAEARPRHAGDDDVFDLTLEEKMVLKRLILFVKGLPEERQLALAQALASSAGTAWVDPFTMESKFSSGPSPRTLKLSSDAPAPTLLLANPFAAQAPRPPAPEVSEPPALLSDPFHEPPPRPDEYNPGQLYDPFRGKPRPPATAPPPREREVPPPNK